MQCDIQHRPGSAVAVCTLEAGGVPVRAEAGSMIGMSPNINMETSSGGLMKGLKSMFSGESFFTNKFSSTGGTAEVIVGAALPGDLTVIEVDSNQGPQGEWHLQRGAFVASDDTVQIDAKSGGLKGMFSGAGLIKMKAHGQGQCVIGAFGAFERIDVTGSYVVDTGHLVAWQGTLDYKLDKAGGGFLSALMSGEGYVCHFTGTGSLYIQTRNATAFGQMIGSKMPPV